MEALDGPRAHEIMKPRRLYEVYGHLVGAPESKGFFPLNYTAPMEEYLREMERLRSANPSTVDALGSEAVAQVVG